ncbi:MAG: class I SAM-dependent methyltransferase [Planctomycetota bacterium]
MTDDLAKQFEELGALYAKSTSHKQGKTLELLVERAASNPGEIACDLGTGTGHTAIALADRVYRIMAVDIAAGMMRSGRELAAEHGITNIRWVQAPAEALPFPDNTFDVLVSRTAAHHFQSLDQACAEMGRVVRRGGRIVITDIAGYDDPDMQEWVHQLEVLHDPSHVKAYTGVEWTQALEAAGFQVGQVMGGAIERLTELPTGTNVDDWCARSKTPPANAAEIRHRLENAPGPVTEMLQIRGDGPELRFSIYKLLLTAKLL